MTGTVQTITIQSGDTLSQIAEKYGVSVDSLQKANGIKDGKIKAGQKINVPIGNTGVQGATDTIETTPKKTPPINETMAGKSFTPHEIRENSIYSNEKIAKTYKKDGKTKAAIATLTTDPNSGYVVINVKKQTTAEELKKLYNIPDGVLRNYNDIGYEWKDIPDHPENKQEKNYGNPGFGKGDRVVVPPDAFEHSGFFSELYRAIVN